VYKWLNFKLLAPWHDSNPGSSSGRTRWPLYICKNRWHSYFSCQPSQKPVATKVLTNFVPWYEVCYPDMKFHTCLVKYQRRSALPGFRTSFPGILEKTYPKFLINCNLTQVQTHKLFWSANFLTSIFLIGIRIDPTSPYRGAYFYAP
jgi:hypothetical protein